MSADQARLIACVQTFARVIASRSIEGMFAVFGVHRMHTRKRGVPPHFRDWRFRGGNDPQRYLPEFSRRSQLAAQFASWLVVRGTRGRPQSLEFPLDLWRVALVRHHVRAADDVMHVAVERTNAKHKVGEVGWCKSPSATEISANPAHCARCPPLTCSSVR